MEQLEKLMMSKKISKGLDDTKLKSNKAICFHI